MIKYQINNKIVGICKESDYKFYAKNTFSYDFLFTINPQGDLNLTYQRMQRLTIEEINELQEEIYERLYEELIRDRAW